MSTLSDGSRTHLSLQKDTPESRPSHAPSKQQKPGGSWRFQWWAGSIIVTNVGPPELRRVEPQRSQAGTSLAPETLAPRRPLFPMDCAEVSGESKKPTALLSID